MGKPFVIINPTHLNDVKLTGKGAYFKQKQIHGLIHCKIRVKATEYPFLQFRAHGKSFCAVCENCVKTENLEICRCQDHQKG